MKFFKNAFFSKLNKERIWWNVKNPLRFSFIHVHLESIICKKQTIIFLHHWICKDRFIALCNQCTMTVCWLNLQVVKYMYMYQTNYCFVSSSWCQQENSKYDIFHRTQGRSVNSSTCKSFRSFWLLIVHFTTGGGWDPLVIFWLT